MQPVIDEENVKYYLLFCLCATATPATLMVPFVNIRALAKSRKRDCNSLVLNLI